MTIERLAQFSAETRVLTDLTLLGSNTALPTISAAQVKTGAYSYALDITKGAFGKAYATPQTAVRMGYWVYLTSATLYGANLYFGGSSRIVGQTNDHIRLVHDTALGVFNLARPLTSTTYETIASVAVPSQFSTTGTWFHVGITHYSHATDGFFSLYVDGVRVLNYVGDTRPSYMVGSTRYFGSTLNYGLGGGGAANSSTSGSTGFVDDFFIDSIVGEADAVVPSRRFMMALPTGAGANAAWTPVPVVANYLNVDDNPNDGDVTYNKALAAGLRDTYHVTDIVLPADHVIVAAIPTPFVKRLDSEAQNRLSLHAYDGSTYAESADLDMSMAYDVPLFARLTTQPNGAAWTEAAFNSCQFGVKSAGVF